MSDEQSSHHGPSLEQHVHVFRKSLPARVKLGEVARCIGTMTEENCLAVVADDLMIAQQLGQRGGSWHVLRLGETNESAATPGIEHTKYWSEGKFPYKDKTFDVVVILDIVERTHDDSALILECHRVLDAAGRLVVCAPRVTNISLLRPLRSMLGVTYDRRGWVRPGYTESQLFNVLKDGFDVHEVRSFGRFFAEFLCIISDAVKARSRHDDRGPTESTLKFHSSLYPFFWLAYNVDQLLFFSRGYYLTAAAKRRTWLPRKTPILLDGRTISEAVLNRIAD